MTGNDASDLDNAPFVIEGDGASAVKIYFESEKSHQEYFDDAAKNPTIDAYNKTADNEMTGTIN